MKTVNVDGVEYVKNKEGHLVPVNNGLDEEVTITITVKDLIVATSVLGFIGTGYNITIFGNDRILSHTGLDSVSSTWETLEDCFDDHDITWNGQFAESLWLQIDELRES